MVEWSTSGDDFDRDQVRARCEGRFSLGVYQATGAVKVSTAAAAGGQQAGVGSASCLAARSDTGTLSPVHQGGLSYTRGTK